MSDLLAASLQYPLFMGTDGIGSLDFTCSFHSTAKDHASLTRSPATRCSCGVSSTDRRSHECSDGGGGRGGGAQRHHCFL
ncbi:hypothetical protein BV898_05011 [Hypsibius exemplaris]|uniref:Uncharacterized protein n=1 Tax=Hypsibius exemplaris TaxID=2072580 RepID=A0A1W0X0D8_HYPEX|nr:hypothetical protein BV898_05011 [Hypsibius exemplaris]